MSEYQYPFLSEEGKVICQVCGKPYLVISPRHLNTHNIKYDEYKLRFPDAPLSSDEFNAAAKYGKEKVVFVEKEMETFEDETDLPDEEVEEIIVDEDPEIEDEINLREELEKENKEVDIMAIQKNKILDHLRIFFTNIEKDYMIYFRGVDGTLKSRFITDFADPVLKVVVDFPKTFWHNDDLTPDPNKKLKLNQAGWKIIEIKSMAPKLSEITSRIERQ